MKIDGCTLGIKTFQKAGHSLSEDPTSPVVVEVHRIELSMRDGTNYLFCEEFGHGHPGLGDAGMFIHRIQEKGEVDMNFWSEGDPVYGSERYLQRELEFIDLEKTKDEEAESYGPRR